MDTSKLMETIVKRLEMIDGIEAIVLGGSRARGTHTDSWDIAPVH
jgi:predicted nucleotidyltransferase